jgi:hypothetical protein
MRKYKCNPLLAVPPGQFHRISDSTRAEHFKDYVDPHAGVHTSGTWNIAASYAMGAWRQSDRQGYPVVITLDVEGLKALPDVDAILQSATSLSYMRSEALQALEDGEDLLDLAEMWHEREYEQVFTPEALVFQEFQEGLNPLAAAFDLYDEEKAERVIAAWANGGELPGDLLSHLIDQRRYLNDFDLDRVVLVEAFKPWYDTIMDTPYDDEPDEALVQAEEDGYMVLTLDDCTHDFSSETETLYEGVESGETQFHGTWSGTLFEAFPGIKFPRKVSF